MEYKEIWLEPVCPECAEVLNSGLMAIFGSPAAALIFVLGAVVAVWIGASRPPMTNTPDKPKRPDLEDGG